MLLLAVFLSCIFKKPDVDDDDLSEDDNQLKQDEEFLSRSERDIQGKPIGYQSHYPGQLSLAIPPWVGILAMVTATDREETACQLKAQLL